MSDKHWIMLVKASGFYFSFSFSSTPTVMTSHFQGKKFNVLSITYKSNVLSYINMKLNETHIDWLLLITYLVGTDCRLIRAC